MSPVPAVVLNFIILIIHPPPLRAVTATCNMAPACVMCRWAAGINGCHSQRLFGLGSKVMRHLFHTDLQVGGCIYVSFRFNRSSFHTDCNQTLTSGVPHKQSLTMTHTYCQCQPSHSLSFSLLRSCLSPVRLSH